MTGTNWDGLDTRKGDEIVSCTESREQEPNEVEPCTDADGCDTELEMETLGRMVLYISDGTPVSVKNLSRG